MTSAANSSSTVKKTRTITKDGEFKKGVSKSRTTSASGSKLSSTRTVAKVDTKTGSRSVTSKTKMPGRPIIKRSFTL